ncbi:MAG: flagellar hook-length control protein FliK [Deltaproteobacteria bacterium]|nr:flagellar hook-length control protein FliK [Deltaproteobacteria bacterium]
MITAIEPEFGIKEGFPNALVKPTGNDSFSRELNKASKLKTSKEVQSNSDDRWRRSGDSQEKNHLARNSRSDDGQSATRIGKSSTRTETADSPEKPGTAAGAKESTEARDVQAGRAEKAVDTGDEAAAGDGTPITREEADARQPSGELEQAAEESAGRELYALFTGSEPVLGQETLTGKIPRLSSELATTVLDQVEGQTPDDFLGPGSRASVAAQIGQSANRLAAMGLTLGQDQAEQAAQEGEQVSWQQGSKAELAGQGEVFTETTEPRTRLGDVPASTLAKDAVIKSEVAEQDRKFRAEQAELGMRLNQTQARDELLRQLQATSADGEQASLEAFKAEVASREFSGALPQSGARHRMESLQSAGEATLAPQSISGMGSAEQNTGAAYAEMAKDSTEVKTAREVISRLAQDVRWMVNNRRSEMSVRLNPEHLGQMQLKVTKQDGTLRVEMTVDNHAAKQLLDSRMVDLHEILAQENLGAETFSVNVDVREGGQFDRGLADSRDLEGRTTSLGQSRTKEEEVASVARKTWSDSKVSIYA